MKSSLFFYFKTSYDNGKSTITTKETLKNAIIKGYITDNEYYEITKEYYAV